MKDIERSSKKLTPQQNELIENHYEFAIKVAFKTTFAKSLNKDDLIDIAQEALIKAAIHFDPGKNVQFTTFAYRVIHNHLSTCAERSAKEIATLDIELEAERDSNDLDCKMQRYEKKSKLYSILVNHHHERDINLLIHRYFTDDRLVTQSELSKHFNLSQPQISFLEKQAKTRIREMLK